MSRELKPLTPKQRETIDEIVRRLVAKGIPEQRALPLAEGELTRRIKKGKRTTIPDATVTAN